VFVGRGMQMETGTAPELAELALGLASGFGRGQVAWPGRVEVPDSDRSPDRVGTSSDRPLHVGRIRRSSEAAECAVVGRVVGMEEVASGEWRVTSLTKQIPRCARNDNSVAV
jgi:hypothetical protein